MINFVQEYQRQGYRTLEIPPNNEKPKALVRTAWQKLPNEENINTSMYAVVQEDNRLVLDIDEPELNYLLEEYRDETLIVKTGNGGLHGYFTDIVRASPIKTTPLYKGEKHVGDIKAGVSYVIGIGSRYEEEGIVKEYKQISSTNKVLEIDFEDILVKLKENGISTKKQKEGSTNNSKSNLLDPATTGERNNQCFKKACLVLKHDNNLDSALLFMKTWNQLNEEPLPESEVETCVRSAKNAVDNHDESITLKHKDDDKITIVANRLIQKYNPKTAANSNVTYIHNGKIYDSDLATKLFKEETETQIENCTTHDVKEVLEKIKRKTQIFLDDFDSDPNTLTVNNGILNLDTLELTPHTPDNLSKILIPCDYITPKSEDIETNLKDTLFWKYLTSSHTIDGKRNHDAITSVLEMMASCFIKHNVDEKSFMNLGNGENGKSVLLDYLSDLLGSDNISHIPLQVLSDDKFACANLDGKLANTFADLERNELKHTGIIKIISSGESIYAQFKHNDGFDLNPICKLIFSCNKFPKVYDQSQGFFRRWVIIEWKRNFEKDPERIDKLKEKLLENQEEKNLVFSSLMQLVKKLKSNDKFTVDQDWKTIQKLWNENADPVNDFVENYIIDSDHSKPKRDTYKFYKRIMFEKGEVPISMGKFGKYFSEYFEEGKNDGSRVWLNIDFKEPIQATLEAKMP
jgi:putative DNA primase/helicase